MTRSQGVTSGASASPTSSLALASDADVKKPLEAEAQCVLIVRGTLGRVEGKLVVSKPKTDRSRRSVPIAEPLVAMLREHRVTQQTEAGGRRPVDR